MPCGAINGTMPDFHYLRLFTLQYLFNAMCTARDVYHMHRPDRARRRCGALSAQWCTAQTTRHRPHDTASHRTAHDSTLDATGHDVR